jgi:hypothetical protein
MIEEPAVLTAAEDIVGEQNDRQIPVRVIPQEAPRESGVAIKVQMGFKADSAGKVVKRWKEYWV